MQPSSLIFVALFAVWAAYAGQYWVRRREHLATARSIDEFTRAMEILERPERPLKREAVTPSAPPAAILRPPTVSVPSSHASASAPGQVSPAAAHAARASRPAPAVRPGPKPSRRTRGLLLLAAVAATLLSAILAPFTSVPWWAPAMGLAATVAALAAVRSAATRERALRAQQRHARRPVASAAPAVAPLERIDHTISEPLILGDLDLVPAPAETAEATGTWAPVPVPPPTYTMKARAERATALPAEEDELPEVRPIRRAVGG